MSACKIIKVGDFTTLYVERESTTIKLGKVIPDSYRLLSEYVDEKGGTLKEAPYVIYKGVEWNSVRGRQSFFSKLKEVFCKKWKLEVGLILENGIEESGDISCGHMDDFEGVEIIHTGPYRKIGDTYNLLLAWADEKAVELSDSSMEFYLNDPQKTRQEDLETRIVVPLKRQ